MSIRFIKKEEKFILHTNNTTYAFEILKGRYLRHLYYGKKKKTIVSEPVRGYSYAPFPDDLEYKYSPDTLPCEVSFFGSGDFRSTSLRIDSDGTGVTDFTYDSYCIHKGRISLDGLPEARENELTETLEIKMHDPVTGCVLSLFYTVYPENDIIGRYMKIENHGSNTVKIENCAPLELPIPRTDLDMISLYGPGSSELQMQRVPLHRGVQSVFSRRGASSHQYNPFFALCSHNATEERGDAFGFNFIYSGSFVDEVEVDRTNTAKVMISLGSDTFGYTLTPGESFISPEAVMSYSAKGIGQMSRNYHDFVRYHIMPSSALEPHPVVLNTWEACGFDIDEEMLIRFADEAGKFGFDMLVMDDGWFGERNDDDAGLGDWYANPAKFPNGLASFVREIKKRGVKFGIWVEPEMVSPKSDLYRAHPDWVLRVPSREPLWSRKQLVLDLSNPEVVEHLMGEFDKVFDGIEIDYFKWDMNRSLCNIGSTALPRERQSEVAFRHMKGVYRLLKWFGERFPNALIETCAGGGGRYDLGMMAFGFQVWASDCTSPHGRIFIQNAALTGYPAATMSCHVSNPENNLMYLDYCYKVALGGMLGYELNILHMSDEIKKTFASQIAEYRQIEHLMRLGDYHNLASPLKYDYSAYYYVNSDNSELLLSVIKKHNVGPGKTKLLKLTRADASATYVDLYTDTEYTGEALRRGIAVPLTGESDTATARLFRFVKK